MRCPRRNVSPAIREGSVNDTVLSQLQVRVRLRVGVRLRLRVS
jgi:hypothetical protein